MKSYFIGFDIFLYDFLLCSLNIRTSQQFDIINPDYVNLYDDKFNLDFLSNGRYITSDDISIIEELFR